MLLSDGDDTTSLVAYDDVMELAKESGISIYTIMIGSGLAAEQDLRRWHPSASKSDFGMKALAQETGARSFFTSNIGALAGVYTSIGRELANQYHAWVYVEESASRRRIPPGHGACRRPDGRAAADQGRIRRAARLTIDRPV